MLRSLPHDRARVRTPLVPHERVIDAVAQAALLATWFIGYLVLRGAVEGTHIAATRHASELMRIESMLGIGIERPLNEVVASGPDAVSASASLLYEWGYWILVVAAMATCWWRSRRHWYVVLRNGLLATTVIGLIIFWRLPVAPPRAMPGFVDVVNGADDHLGQRPPGGTNVYAAMPSFHAGWSIAAAVITGFTINSRIGRRMLWMAGAAMTPVVIVTANHYVLDALIGIAVTGACVVAAQHVHAQRRESFALIATNSPPPRRIRPSTDSAPA